MIRKKMIKALVFDFDGVIVRDSEFLKESAWDEIFKGRSDWSPEMSKVLFRSRQKFSGGKGSRFDILRDFFIECGTSEDVISGLVQEAANLYNNAVQTGILRLGITTDDKEAIQLLSKHFPLYINSATPEAGVRESADKLGINPFFVGVFGQPTKKVENLKRAAEHAVVGVKDILFIGDGAGDIQAAKECGCQFVGIANRHNKWTMEPFPLLHSIAELPRFLNIG